MKVERLGIYFTPDKSRVLIRPFISSDPNRNRSILDRVLTIPETEVDSLLNRVYEEFDARHIEIQKTFEENYNRIGQFIPKGHDIPPKMRLLIGAYFTHEYSLECAALFNPSIVPHYDQTEVPVGSLRYILSLRATGEGHISSIEFRTGLIDKNGNVHPDPPSKHVTNPDMLPDPTFDKNIFLTKLESLNNTDGGSRKIIEVLPDAFTLSQLYGAMDSYTKDVGTLNQKQQRSVTDIQWLARSNYEIRFSSSQPISGRAIFPISANESNGIEDARFVRFTDDNGSVSYYATYTAYNGHVILPQLLETADFLHFKIGTLGGNAVKNKGMAIFPRRINGKYVTISRQDGENLYIMYSDNIYIWSDAKPLFGPRAPWEYTQIGNCGSPIETDHGWLLLTHGVGPMRKYCIGAMLLDRDDPSRVAGWLREPLISPDENERDGYVPNVVYTCGALVHNDWLIIPYAMSDYASTVARIRLDDVIDSMEKV
jgi:predicted GH43/DUF377 family glycosyl hydrolase